MNKEDLIKELNDLGISTDSKFAPAKNEISVYEQIIKKLHESKKPVQAIPPLVSVHPKNDMV
jgi:hypothetical protein